MTLKKKVCVCAHALVVQASSTGCLLRCSACVFSPPCRFKEQARKENSLLSSDGTVNAGVKPPNALLQVRPSQTKIVRSPFHLDLIHLGEGHCACASHSQPLVRHRAVLQQGHSCTCFSMWLMVPQAPTATVPEVQSCLAGHMNES